MIAIKVTLKTKYGCNLGYIGIKYDCNHQKFVFERYVQKSLSRDSSAISDIESIYGHYWKRLQAYIVRFGF